MPAKPRSIALLVGLACARLSVPIAEAQPLAEAAPGAQPAALRPEPATTAPAPPDPPADVQAVYREVVMRAVSEFDSGRFAEARALFMRAHELWPNARTLRTLGMTSFELGTYPRALAELQSALDDPRRPLPSDQRADVLRLIEQTRAYVGRYRVQLSPPDAELSIDGTPAQGASVLVLALGDHVLLARSAGYRELRRTLIVQGREDEDLQLSLEQLSPPMPEHAAADKDPQHASEVRRDQAPSVSGANRTPAFVAFGVGAAGVAVGTIAGVIALGKKHDVDRASGYRAADISTVAFITAGVSAAVGAVLLLTASAPHDAANAAWLHPQGRYVRPIIGMSAIGVEGRL